MSQSSYQSESANPVRSSALLSASTSVLVVVDVQEKLIPLIPHHRRLVWNIGRLLQAAQVFQVPVLGTEQYPRGLGPTVPELRHALGPVPEKLTFSCLGCPEFASQLDPQTRWQVVLVGIETHVCVQQTALDLMEKGLDVFVVADAVGARAELDHQIALRRMESAGATLTTTESVMFEWCQRAGTEQFKSISQLVRQSPPEEETSN